MFYNLYYPYPSYIYNPSVPVLVYREPEAELEPDRTGSEIQPGWKKSEIHRLDF
jgi:hypothetical protein